MNVKEKNILYTLKSDVLRLQSQVDRLEGKVASIREEVISQSKKIQDLETKQITLDGFRSNLS